MQNSLLEFFNRAIIEEKAGNYDAALKLYSKILAANNTHFESWLNSGTIYSRLKKYEKAIKCYEQAILIRKDSRVLYNLGLAYYNQKKLKNALKYFSESLSINPEFFQGYLLMGYVLIELNNSVEAVKYIQSGLTIHHNHPSLLICLAIAHQSLGDEENCISIINQVLNQNPEHNAALRFKARLSISKNVTRSAIENFRKIISIDKDIFEMEAIVDRPENAALKNGMQDKKDEIMKKTMKSREDFLNLSLISLLNGNGNAALNYLLYATKDK